MSLISEFREARQRVTTLMREHAHARGRMNYFDHRAYRHPFVKVTDRRQVDALIYMRSIRAKIQPSEVVIVPGTNSNDLFNRVTAANLGCPVILDQREKRSTRGFSKYLKEYYQWKGSEESLEEAKATRWRIFNQLKDLQILRVCTVADLRDLIEIRNGGGWIGGNIVIPDHVVLDARVGMEDMAARQGIQVLPWNQFATASH